MHFSFFKFFNEVYHFHVILIIFYLLVSAWFYFIRSYTLKLIFTPYYKNVFFRAWA
ncbi:MAG: hypothetical protein OJF59_000171 [Cytophagales bacterium]|nr:MAG: hypothetical protein OJF59_000171 [Cytophagales bacterium]